MNTMSAILNITIANMNTTSAAMNTTTDFNGTTGSAFLSPSNTSNVPWNLAWQSNDTWDPWVANWSPHTVPQFNKTTPKPKKQIHWTVWFLIAVGLAIIGVVICSCVLLDKYYDSEQNAVTSGQPDEPLTRRQRYHRTDHLRRRRGPFNCCATQEEKFAEDVGNQGFESECNSIEMFNIIYLIIIISLTEKICFSHWESPWECSKIEISMRSWARTSLRIKNLVKNLVKNLIKNQDLGQDRIEILIEIFNEKKSWLRFSIKISMRSCPRSWFLMRFLMRFLILNEVLDEVLDSQWGSCPRPQWDLNFGLILLRFSMRKTKFFPYGIIIIII